MTTGSIGGGAAAVPGANKQVIFNDAGVLAGDSGLTYDKATDALTVAGTGATVGLDLSTSDKYADLRVIRNSRNSVDHAMFLGYNPTPAGSPCAVYIYNDNTWRAGFDAAGVTLPGLAGTGSRVVEANASGVLSAPRIQGAVLLDTTTFASAVSSIQRNGVFTTAYRDYLIITHIDTLVTGGTLSYRLAAAGTPVTNGYSVWGIYGASNAATINGTFSNLAAQWAFFGLAGERVDGGFWMWLHCPAHVMRTQGQFVGAAMPYSSSVTTGTNYIITQSGANAYDGLQTYMSAGTMTGQQQIWGMVNS